MRESDLLPSCDRQHLNASGSMPAIGRALASTERSGPGRLLRSPGQDAWLSAQNQLLGALGSARLGQAILEIAAERFRASEIFGFRLRGGEIPEMLVSQGSRGHAARRASLYLSRFCSLDPIRTPIRQHAREDCVTLASFRACDIADDTYRWRCFEHAGLTEKIACFHRAGDDVFVLCFYRAEAKFQQLESLVDFARLALPVLQRHCAQLGDEAGLTLPERLQQRLAAHFPSLTDRERGVCARTLAGMTSEAIALELGIGRTSVLTYRRRAYERYGVSSAGQFIENILG